MIPVKKRFGIIAAFFCLSACKLDAPVYAPATVDFSTFIAIGDSQTAGYADDGLYREAQLSSFPAIMANQMKSAGGGDFYQPLFPDAEANGSGYLKISGLNATGLPSLVKITSKLGVKGSVAVPGYGNITLYSKYQGEINNYGVAGIKLSDIDNNLYGNVNGYFERLLPGSAPNHTTSYLDFVTAKPFTFFTCWLGNNDVLGYAVAGGGSASRLTSKATFNQAYNLLITRLTSNKQKGAVATIPDVAVIPFFNTIKISQIQDKAKALNIQLDKVYIRARQNSDVSDGSYTTRVATAKDLVVLNFDITKIGSPVSSPTGLQPYGLSPAAPIEDQYILDENEAIIAADYISSYNATIKQVAAAHNLAVFDAYTTLNKLKQGVITNGIQINADFITGGVFSTDGIHLTPRGYAYEANGFINAINAKYGSTLSPVDISKYGGVKLP